jgi:tetratricopeptide (TPR) repeat protein
MASGPRPRVRAAALLLLALSSAVPFALGCSADPSERIRQARALRESGDPVQAIGILRELVEQDPEDLEASYELGLALARADQANVALVYLRRAEASPTLAAAAGMELATLFAKTGNPEEAIRALTRVLEREPDNVDALVIRAKGAIEIGEFERALADADRALANDPDRADALHVRGTALERLGRTSEAERSIADLVKKAETGGDPAGEAQACAIQVEFLAHERKDAAAAERALARCAERYPGAAQLVPVALAVYDEKGKPDAAIALLRAALEKNPDALGVRQEIAKRLPEQEAAAGEALLREGAERAGAPAGWAALADYQRKRGRPEDALDSIERALALTAKAADPLLLVAVDLNAELGRIEAAEAAAARMELPVYRDFAAGRIALAKDDPRAALEHLTQGLRSWPNNAGARYLAGLAALEQGDVDRAIAEFVEATRADDEATDGALLAAQLYLRKGDFERAIQMADRQYDHRKPGRLQALLVAGRAEQARGGLAGAQLIAEKAAREFPKEPHAVSYHASVVRRIEGPKAAAKQLAASDVDLTDPANEAAIRMLAELHAEAGEPARALALADAGVAKHADSAFFHELRGRILVVTGKPDEARTELERALEIDPEHAAASAALGTLLGRSGDVAGGLELLDAAAKLEPDEPDHAYQAALLVLAQGKEDDAIARLRAILERDPTHASSCNELAWLLASRKQDLPLAQTLALRAVRLNPGPEELDTLGWVHLQSGNAKAAADALRASLAVRPDAPGSRYRLGLALAALGRTAEAERALREALAGGDFRESGDARARLAELERGSAKP